MLKWQFEGGSWDVVSVVSWLGESSGHRNVMDSGDQGALCRLKKQPDYDRARIILSKPWWTLSYYRPWPCSPQVVLSWTNINLLDKQKPTTSPELLASIGIPRTHRPREEAHATMRFISITGHDRSRCSFLTTVGQWGESLRLAEYYK